MWIKLFAVKIHILKDLFTEPPDASILNAYDIKSGLVIFFSEYVPLLHLENILYFPFEYLPDHKFSWMNQKEMLANLAFLQNDLEFVGVHNLDRL